mgnify:FL=1
MYCSNCGNKVDDNAYVCVNCGVILKKRTNNIRNIKVKNNNVIVVFSLIFGIISVISSFSLFFYDISEVGMYTKALERIMYGLGFASISILFTIISLVFALIKKDNKVGVILTIISAFLILSEIFVIVVY